jgi:hypothetical protein
MVRTSENNSLFLINFTKDGVLTFRTSRNPKYLQTEKVVIDKNKVYTNLYFFDISYLQKFLYENR